MSNENTGITARDLFGVVVRVIGLIIIILAVVGLVAQVLELQTTQEKFGLTLGLGQIAFLLTPSLAALAAGFLFFFGARIFVWLAYGRDGSR